MAFRESLDLEEDNSIIQAESCLTCRGNGLPDGCPTCGKVSGVLKLNLEDILPDTEEANQAIPEVYRDIEWDVSKLLTKHSTVPENPNFVRYATKLDKLYAVFESGRIPQCSGIIIAPRTYGKMTLAYSCMKQALLNSHTVIPILDNTEIKRINIRSSERATYSLRSEGISMEDILNADICFTSVDVDNFRTSFQTIDSLMSKRARLGKPTFVLSRFSLASMSEFKYGRDSYTRIIDRSQDKIDRLRYPVIVEFMEG